MAFDPEALAAAMAAHGPVARVVVAEARGSAPREAGAAMLVWADGQEGTIGGGTLEFEAAARARVQLAAGGTRVDRLPLGPALGQCCGGAVVLVTEVFKTVPETGDDVFARPVASSRDMPLSVSRLLTRARNQGDTPTPQLIDGWLVEPVARPTRALWVWGAGHVGRAIVTTLAPMPDFAITWVDTAPSRFPRTIPDGVTPLPAAEPVRLIPHAPKDAEHLILTYSHELDLALCSGLLSHGFGQAGLIGSATKWARFHSRLASLGHSPAQIARIRCPIGDPALGKHPQAIAVGVAAALLREPRRQDLRKDKTA